MGVEVVEVVVMEAAGNMHGYLMKTFTSKEHTEGTSVLNPGVLVEGLHAFLFFSLSID